MQYYARCIFTFSREVVAKFLRWKILTYNVYNLLIIFLFVNQEINYFAAQPPIPMCLQLATPTRNSLRRCYLIIV